MYNSRSYCSNKGSAAPVDSVEVEVEKREGG